MKSREMYGDRLCTKMVFNTIFCSELFKMRLGPKVGVGLIPDVDRGYCGSAAKVLLLLCPFILLGLVRWDFCSPGRRRLESKGPGQYVVSVRRRRWVRGFWSIEMGLGHGPVGIASERAVWDVFEGFW